VPEAVAFGLLIGLVEAIQIMDRRMIYTKKYACNEEGTMRIWTRFPASNSITDPSITAISE
jgi:hypothetical protein